MDQRFRRAMTLFNEHQKLSNSYLQRKLGISWYEANKILVDVRIMIGRKP